MWRVAWGRGEALQNSWKTLGQVIVRVWTSAVAVWLEEMRWIQEILTCRLNWNYLMQGLREKEALIIITCSWLTGQMVMLSTNKIPFTRSSSRFGVKLTAVLAGKLLGDINWKVINAYLDQRKEIGLEVVLEILDLQWQWKLRDGWDFPRKRGLGMELGGKPSLCEEMSPLQLCSFLQ